MKQLKKTMAVLLVLALAITGIHIGMARVDAENPLTVYGDAVTAAPGKEVKIPIKVKDNHGVAGLALKVTYDASVMMPAKAEKGSLLSGLANLQFGDTIANHTENSFECVAYNDSNFSDHGELMVLTFQMAENAAAGSYALKLELTEHYNEALTDIEAGCEDIAVTVGNSIGTSTASPKPGVSAKPGVSSKPQTTKKPNATAKPSNNYSKYDDPTPKPKKKKARKVTKKPGRVKITKIKNIGKGKAKVTWKKVKCNSGYNLEYCRKKNFSGKVYTRFVSKSKKTCVIKGTSKKAYYVRIYAENYGYPSKYAEYRNFILGKNSKVKKIKLK